MHDLFWRLSLLNGDCDLRGVLDHARIRGSSHADHIARRLPAAAAATTGDLEQHQQGEQEKAAGCPICVHRVQPPAETHRVSAVPFCAYENFGDCSQAPEKAWRPRRDLNPCYRRESCITL